VHQYEFQNLRQEELLAEAERYRLISLANQRSSNQRNFLATALAWWGSKLSRWGGVLQERFGDTVIVEDTRVIN
jgi:hypothetical protein